MKKLFITASVLLAAMTLQAQFTYDYLKAADQYYKKEDYNSAVQYYEKYLGTRNKAFRKDSYKPYAAVNAGRKTNIPVSSEQQAVYKLAESYRNLHNFQKAAPHYETVLEADGRHFPLAAYYYAVSLRSLGKYEEAEKAFHSFLQGYGSQDGYSAAAEKEVKNLAFINAQLKRSDLSLYEIKKAPAALNTTGASYAPLWTADGALLFTSTRPDPAKNKGFVNRVYTADYTNGQAANIRLLTVPQPESLHQGAVSISPDGQQLFITRWQIDHGKKIASIWSARKSGSGWGEPVILDALINVPGSNTQQPFVLPDGKHLLYASDRPGGQGGFDLWYATLDETGKPVSTANLGEVINTAGNEQAPYYHAATHTLVFSTDGRTGMGGYDFFSSKGEPGSFQTPVNMGYPVNSVKDDIYFASHSNTRNLLDDVLLGTDRAAECCLELFFLHKNRPPRQLSGVVVACGSNTPVAGAEVRIVDTVSNQVVTTRNTAADGSYAFALEEYQPLVAVANAVGYTQGTQHIGIPENEDTAAITAPALCLKPIVPPPSPVTLENVYYDYDKATLKPESFASLDKLVTLLQENPAMEIELTAHTDSIGTRRYNQRLSEARARSCVDYLVEKGIDRHRLASKGYGASMPIAPNSLPDGSDNPEGRQKNRRTTFTILKK
ncbi:OmpA family protein [Chitinophaga qingshengii]|uniref:OmpA family protein n=1 Tax=Chitinophaga qingshengii TaxID=1569794 RepID=A0ABR7TRJ4_9BACT|nr:OmpA family protein [Chitinophaga qingshengii]MBC9932625.1 OmpA family protein [Chitinophaga qingshengii]